MNSSPKKGGIIVLLIGLIIFATTIFVVFGSAEKNKPEDNTEDHEAHHSNAPEGTNNENFLAMIGKPVPKFELKDRDGKTYSPETLRGKNVVLFFNEGLMCYPACWNQIASLAEDNRFAALNTVVLSVVVDPVNEWQKAVGKMPELGKATVVFDGTKSASRDFGVLNLESSMHRGSLPGHTYIIIDSNGIVRSAFDDPNMANNNGALVEQINKFFNA